MTDYIFWEWGEKLPEDNTDEEIEEESDGC